MKLLPQWVSAIRHNRHPGPAAKNNREPVHRRHNGLENETDQGGPIIENQCAVCGVDHLRSMGCTIRDSWLCLHGQWSAVLELIFQDGVYVRWSEKAHGHRVLLE